MGLLSQAVALYHLQEGKLNRNSPYIQVLEEDWRQALQEHQKQASTIFSLRKDLRQAEALRTRVRDQAGQANNAHWAPWKVGSGT